jgi:hypothetical protein
MPRPPSSCWRKSSERWCVALAVLSYSVSTHTHITHTDTHTHTHTHTKRFSRLIHPSIPSQAEERQRLAEEAERQTLALLRGEEEEEKRRAEDEARALREMLAAERVSGHAWAMMS